MVSSSEKVKHRKAGTLRNQDEMLGLTFPLDNGGNELVSSSKEAVFGPLPPSDPKRYNSRKHGNHYDE